MPEFLEWLFPWSHVDAVLKFELLIWFGTVVAAFWIYVRTIWLGKQWLPLRFAKDKEEKGSNAH